MPLAGAAAVTIAAAPCWCPPRWRPPAFGRARGIAPFCDRHHSPHYMFV